MKYHLPAVALTLFATTTLSGCASMNHTERGALLGSGIGAATGAIVGHQTGHRDGGALVGALAGGLIGGLAGKSEDVREERDVAIAQADYANRQRQFVQRALTNASVVQMTQNNVSDTVIINAIRSRGGMFDLSPEGIIALKQQGVSDTVIQFAQQNGHPSNEVQPTDYTVAPRTRTIYVAPAPGPVIIHRPPVVVGPSIHVHGRFGPRRRWHRHHHHW